MPLAAERRQVLFREPKQAHGRAKPFSVFWMGRMLVMFLEMDECPGRLDQPLEVLGILRRDAFAEPDLLQDIVRFVVSLFVPAPEKSAVIGMSGDAVRRARRFACCQRFDKT
jgi:hypothetical protein